MPRFFGPSELILAAAEGLRQAQALGPTAPLVVGFGGGPDALALAWALQRLGHPLHLRFVDHGLPLDGPMEWPAAQRAAAWLGLPVTRLLMATQPRSEDAARKARHQALQTEAQQLGASGVALGHHADDQAETLLFRLARGTGPKGAGAMAPWRPWVQGGGFVRPLLALRRHQLRRALQALGAPVHEDEANLDLARSRNHLRHEVLPHLEARHPGAGLRLAEAAQRFREASDGLLEEGQAWAKLVAPECGPSGALVDANAWLSLPPSQVAFAWQAILQGCQAPAGLGEGAVLKALRLAVGRGEALALPGGWRWQPDRAPWWGLLAPPRPGLGPTLPFAPEGPQGLAGWGWSVCVRPFSPGAGGGVGLDSGGLCRVPLAAEGPHGPWLWRLADPLGDRLSPPGGHQQPLARFLGALGWPRARMGRLLVLASGEEVGWVVGVALGAAAHEKARPACFLATAEAHLGPHFGGMPAPATAQASCMGLGAEA